MAPITEIMIFEASEASRNNLANLFPSFDIVLKVKGAIAPCYYGLQIENGTTAYMFFNWVDLASHKALIDAPSYPDLLANFKPCLQEGSKCDMWHVEFSAPTIALDQPVTDITVLTLKAPEHRAVVVDILSQFSEVSGKSVVFGQTLEDENTYVVMGGWESVEEHSRMIAIPEIAAVLERLDAFVNREQRNHTKLLRYTL